MAEHDPAEERDCERTPSGERKLADVVEAKEQTQDYLARDAQLVSSRFILFRLSGGGGDVACRSCAAGGEDEGNIRMSIWRRLGVIWPGLPRLAAVCLRLMASHAASWPGCVYASFGQSLCPLSTASTTCDFVLSHASRVILVGQGCSEQMSK